MKKAKKFYPLISALGAGGGGLVLSGLFKKLCLIKESLWRGF